MRQSALGAYLARLHRVVDSGDGVAGECTDALDRSSEGLVS